MPRSALTEPASGAPTGGTWCGAKRPELPIPECLDTRAGELKADNRICEGAAGLDSGVRVGVGQPEGAQGDRVGHTGFQGLGAGFGGGREGRGWVRVEDEGAGPGGPEFAATSTAAPTSATPTT